MNKVCLIGRLTAKPELRYTNSNVAFTRFSLAVNRNFNNQDGIREADFINCIAWRKTAEIITKYLDIGRKIGLEGRIQTGSYEDKDGNKRQSFDVVVDDITFLDKMEENKQKKKDDTTITTEELGNDPFEEFGESVSIENNFLD